MGAFLHATPVFSSASLFPEDPTPCWLFSLIMASPLLGGGLGAVFMLFIEWKGDSENTAKPRRNCSGEALPDHKMPQTGVEHMGGCGSQDVRKGIKIERKPLKRLKSIGKMLR